MNVFILKRLVAWALRRGEHSVNVVFWTLFKTRTKDSLS